MLPHIAGNGARTIIVETANRVARDLVVQETGHRMMKDKGIKIIAAESPGAFVDDAPTSTFVRQVLGVVAQLDKAMTVAKLRGARERKRRQADWARVELHCTSAMAAVGVKRPDISDKDHDALPHRRLGLPSRVEIGKICSKTLAEYSASQPRPVEDPAAALSHVQGALQTCC